jgi:hypothetical protein
MSKKDIKSIRSTLMCIRNILKEEGTPLILWERCPGQPSQDLSIEQFSIRFMFYKHEKRTRNLKGGP